MIRPALAKALAPYSGMMRGVVPTIDASDEAALRAAGYMPVIRWVRVKGSGGLSDKAITTRAALRTVRRHARTKRGRRHARP